MQILVILMIFKILVQIYFLKIRNILNQYNILTKQLNKILEIKKHNVIEA